MIQKTPYWILEWQPSSWTANTGTDSRVEECSLSKSIARHEYPFQGSAQLDNYYSKLQYRVSHVMRIHVRPAPGNMRSRSSNLGEGTFRDVFHLKNA